MTQICLIYPIVLYNKIYFNKFCIGTYQNGDLSKYNNKVWNLFSDSYHNGYFHLIYPKFQWNKDCLTKLCILICKGVPKYEIMQNIITKFWAGPELYTENAIYGPNLPHWPKILTQ